MHYRNRADLRLPQLVLISLVGFALVSVFRMSSGARAGDDSDQQQDVMRLENRLTRLEQRLFSIENSLRNLEQQSRAVNMPSRSVSNDEVATLRAELQALERRLTDDECGMAKLDERTLSPQRRDTRKRSVAGDNNPCRLNFDAPLRFP